jgi:hypothetical protein
MNEKETQFLIDFLSNKYLRGAERKKALELAFKELGENSISMTEKKELRGYLMRRARGVVSEDKIEYGKKKSSNSKDESVEQGWDEGSEKVTKEKLSAFLKMGKLAKEEMPEKQESQSLFKIGNPTIHNPKALVDLLMKFTSNESSLKYVTHNWEPGRFNSYENFINQVKKDWKEIRSPLKALKRNLEAKISNFLMNKYLGTKKSGEKYLQVWGMNRLKFGWSNPELKQYLDAELRDPFQFPIPDRIKQLEREVVKSDLFYFQDYVDYFKNEIQIREEGDMLQSLFDSLHAEILNYDFNLEYVSLTGISFFTDVQWFKESLVLIIKAFRKHPEYKDVRISVDRNHDEGYILLKICQIGSRCTRDLRDKRIALTNEGDWASLAGYLKNLCDWSIEAKFPDNKFYRINYLISDIGNQTVEEIEKVDGFTHVMKFYL